MSFFAREIQIPFWAGYKFDGPERDVFGYVGEASMEGVVVPKIGKKWGLKIWLTNEELQELKALVDRVYARHTEDIIAQGSVVEGKT